MAARIDIKEDELIISIEGIDKFLALKGTLRVPLDHIHGVSARPEVNMGWTQGGIRAPGTAIPNVIRAGSYYHVGDGWHFYDVRDPAKSIAIDLADQHYKRIVVQVEEETPEEAVERIKDAIHKAARG